jgi:signal transduction histidine kinase
MRVGLNLRVSLIVAPLVVAMLALALALIGSYLSLRAALHDVRREIAFVLHLSRLDILAVRQSVESFGAAFHGEDAGDLREVESEARASLDALAGWDFPPRRSELLERIERAYARLAEAGERAVELARRGEREAATRLVTDTVEAQRDAELLPLVDAAQIEGSLALRKALDSLLASSARLSLASPSAGLAADVQSLRAEAAQAISVARLASRAQRLVGRYRGFAYFGESREELAVAEHRFDRAYRIWEAQVGARGKGAGATAPASEGDIRAGYRALKEAVGGFAGLDPRRDPAGVIRVYESQLEPLGNEALPRLLTAAFEAREARISALVDSIGRRSRFAGVAISVVAVLAVALALLCPWLISRWIVRPVHALTRAARELGAGLGSRPVAVHGGGELGELAATFNQMAQQLAERTRELEAERARERLRHAERLAAVGTLASGIAHQINNPLNNIMLTAEHALGEDGPEAARHRRAALEACAEEAKRCERIVRGLVAFARGKPGEKWTEDANRVLERARDLTAACAAQHRATVELQLCEAAVPIRASPIALEQALVNIIQNAIESRPGAHVTLCTEIRNGTVRIAVRDDGRGVGGETFRHLFDPFFTTRAAEGGTGLGLSVARRIIADHHGTINVDSRPGEGTLVSVDLPLAPAGEARR